MYVIDQANLLHMDSYYDIIEHYGVRGMKWGSRKMSNLQFKYNKAKEIAASRRRAIKGNSEDIKRARIKRAVAGHFIAGPLAAAIGAVTVSRRNLERSANKFDKRATRIDKKMRKLELKQKKKQSINSALSKIGKYDDDYSKGKIDKKTYKKREREYSNAVKSAKAAYKAKVKALK